MSLRLLNPCPQKVCVFIKRHVLNRFLFSYHDVYRPVLPVLLSWLQAGRPHGYHGVPDASAGRYFRGGSDVYVFLDHEN